MSQPGTTSEGFAMDNIERPIPALVPPEMAPTGDGYVVPSPQECPGRSIPAAFAGLRWRLVPDKAAVRRAHAKP